MILRMEKHSAVFVGYEVVKSAAQSAENVGGTPRRLNCVRVANSGNQHQQNVTSFSITFGQ